MTVKVEIDGKSLQAYLQAGEAKEVLRGETREILQDAVAGAPVNTGNYKRFLQMKEFRSGYRVVSFDTFGHLIEFGSVNNPAYAPIRHAAEASGFRFVESPKATEEEE